jgi:pimeloyl-ACP methyl ester carboxylesterase
MQRRSFVWVGALELIAGGTSRRFVQATSERHEVVKNGTTPSRVTLRGAGSSIVFIASLGRGVEDFDDLSRRLVRVGYRVLLPDPRGIGASSGPMEGLTLHDLAADVAAVIRAAGGGPATVVGHAFGNRVARMVATDHPSPVNRVVLLAAGGTVEMSPTVRAAFLQVFQMTLPKEERIRAIGQAFFAPGHDASVWERGWYPDVVRPQQAAGAAVDVKMWWAGGFAPIVVLQALDDLVAVPENSRRLASEFPNRVTLIEIPNAGHAMLPEQPELIATAILSKLR